MKLHYSQTRFDYFWLWIIVLLPYEITLLSNEKIDYKDLGSVLLPYEITLLSNDPMGAIAQLIVLLPYEITLLSNCIGLVKRVL